jgi:regulator of PEP synthase PpsR (kinase-PPPase family)
MVDPVALKNFFDKAQRLRPNQSTTIPNNLDLTSTDTNALLAFTANEEELTQIRERIREAENKLEQLELSSIDKQLKEEHKKVKFLIRRKKNDFVF